MDADQIPHPPWCSERRCTAIDDLLAQAGVGL
jgi:hypothetical protein